MAERETRGLVRFLRPPELLARTDCRGASLRAARPRASSRPVSLGDRAVGWTESKVGRAKTRVRIDERRIGDAYDRKQAVTASLGEA